MPLYLVAPGTRKGNRYYLVRGKIDGRDLEVSTKTTDKSAARRFALELELKYLESAPPSPGDDVTFAAAARAYRAFRKPSMAEIHRLDRVTAILGQKLVTKIRHADLVAAACQLNPQGAASTKNREVLRPAAAVLHYAAKNEWCKWLRVKAFEEDKPKTRAVSKDTARTLIANTTGDQRLLLLWLFRQGPRISDALAIKCENVDLKARTVKWRIGKTDEWVIDPLHDEVFDVIANWGGLDEDYLFPWRTKSGVYKWLRPLCNRLNVRFTPHMARHSVGKWLNETGASLRTIMDALHHADPKSSARYQSTDHDALRRATAKMGSLTGNSGSSD